MQKTLVVINGPTAIGKTQLALAVATHFHTEIISADARQFYREMSIGTAKPTEAELATVKHHFINNQSIHHLYSAGEFEKEALQCLDELFTKHDMVIAIGGSGLYLKALCEGLDEAPEANLALRNALINLFEKEGIAPLQKKLQEADPERWLTIDQQNPQRLMRAIEMAHQNVLTTNSKKNRPFKIIKVGLQTGRVKLYSNINERVDIMMKTGLEEEAKKLYPFRDQNALKTVGYNELFDYLDGTITIEKAVELIKQHTRNYAKRQITWFKKDLEINWFEPSQTSEIIDWLGIEMHKV